jgi:hypothetical protein
VLNVGESLKAVLKKKKKKKKKTLARVSLHMVGLDQGGR